MAYTITYNSNGGSSVSQATGVTTLPSTLPTTTKAGYTFVAWYYESNFQTRAKAGDTIESDVTLYAKWHNLGSLFTEIADAIRSKDGTSENIRDVDFGERVKQIQGAKEEETKTVTPNFSSGNQVITPTSGKVLSQVTINKDSNLIPENIKKDVTVHGITGTLESGGDSARTIPEETSGNKYVYLTVFGYNYPPNPQENPTIKITITKDNVDYEISPIANIGFNWEYFLVFEIPYNSGVTLKKISQEQHHYTDSGGWYWDFHEGGSEIWFWSLTDELVENTDFTISGGTVYFSPPISVYSRLHMYLKEYWMMS